MWRLLCVSFLLMVIVWGSYSASNQKRKKAMKEMMEKVAILQDHVSELKGDIHKIHDIETNLTALAETIKDSPFENENEKTIEKCQVVQRCPSVYNRLVRDEEGYLLAFRLTAGIGKSAYIRYLAVGNNDDDNDQVFNSVPCGCKTPNGNLHCDRHYRSVLLDLWPHLHVDTVKVSVYKKGEALWHMAFDGRNSDYLTFFRQARLLEDPYTDLSPFEPKHKGYGSHFSIKGEPHAQRRFFINNSYGGCPKDVGWLVVGDARTMYCPWGRAHQSGYPFILYATTRSRTHNGTEKYEKANWLSGSTARADVLTVSIKLTEDGECTAKNWKY